MSSKRWLWRGVGLLAALLLALIIGGSAGAAVQAACWNAFEQIVPPVPAPQAAWNDFSVNGIAAPANDDVWAVGGAHAASDPKSQYLLAHWTGGQWQAIFTLTPDQGPSNTIIATGLNAVAVAGINDVWAVGRGGIVHWNGLAATLVAAPNVGELHGVAALAANNVWAVGDTGILHWDGAKWSQSPKAAGARAIAASGPADVWAVGGATIQHWDGSAWSTSSITNPPGADLNAVAIKGDQLWAVGSVPNGNDDRTLVLRRNAGAWQQLAGPALTGPGAAALLSPLACCPDPNAQPKDSQFLRGVVVNGANDVWVAGFRQYGYSNDIPNWTSLVAHWNGQAWTLETLPVMRGGLPNALAQAPNGDLWTAGQHYGGGLFGGLIMHRSASAPDCSIGGSATPPSRLFPETGQTVAGRFLDYWNSNGGLAQQGYPVSGEFKEKSDLDGKTYTVQYFERAVFESHPDNNPPYDVLLSQLGTFEYRLRYVHDAPNQVPNKADNGRFFAETGHWIGGKFRDYWEAHGGLAQQGYPISDEFTEQSPLDAKDYTVQYFERAVFEYHPENVGTPYVVLLSQLGSFQAQRKYPGGFPQP